MSDRDDRTTAIAAVLVASSTPETLPGLDEAARSSLIGDRGSNLERAVLATLDEYRSAGLLTARDAGKVALAIDLVRVMDGKRTRGRTSTYSNDARLLNEILDGFVGEEAGGDERLREAMSQWAALLTGLGAGAAIAAAS